MRRRKRKRDEKRQEEVAEKKEIQGVEEERMCEGRGERNGKTGKENC